jgi:hypothetical protein
VMTWLYADQCSGDSLASDLQAICWALFVKGSLDGSEETECVLNTLASQIWEHFAAAFATQPDISRLQKVGPFTNWWSRSFLTEIGGVRRILMP